MPSTSHSPLPRRTFLGQSLGAAGCAATIPAGGVFAAGDDRLRVGLVGCGGRGTGAALHAAAADAGVRITALADLFPDQIASAAAVLVRHAGHAFDCPPERRFCGGAAWRHLIEADVDIVILATPPDARPLQAAAAVAAGRHLFCETPAAVDAAGGRDMLSTCAEARRRGLSIVSGLSWRRDPATVAAIGRIHAGAIGRPLHAVASSCIGLPWHWPAQPAWTAAETVRRNWIACERQSGGHFVEQQIHPLDKLLWALGDEQPLAAEAIAAGGDGHAGTAVRYHFADGRTLEAGIVRRAGGPDRIEERVHGTAGTCDLRRHATAAGGRHRLGMEALVRAVRSGSREDDGDALCRSTLAALLGRAAAARGGTVSWAALAADPAPVGAALAAGLAALQPV